MTSGRSGGAAGYIGLMFEVLVFVYENYWHDACPEPQQLGCKLSARGFDDEEIPNALHWLDGLSLATQGVLLARHADGVSATVVAASANRPPVAPSPDAMRIYSVAEQDHLGAKCMGFPSVLETSRVLPAGVREIVIERAMAAAGRPGGTRRTEDHGADGLLEHRHRARCAVAGRAVRRHPRAHCALNSFFSSTAARDLHRAWPAPRA